MSVTTAATGFRGIRDPTPLHARSTAQRAAVPAPTACLFIHVAVHVGPQAAALVITIALATEATRVAVRHRFG
jgi:hypothetical protein